MSCHLRAIANQPQRDLSHINRLACHEANRLRETVGELVELPCLGDGTADCGRCGDPVVAVPRGRRLYRGHGRPERCGRRAGSSSPWRTSGSRSRPLGQTTSPSTTRTCAKYDGSFSGSNIGPQSCPVRSVSFTTPSSKVTRRSEEHTSELQSLMRNSYAVLCL